MSPIGVQFKEPSIEDDRFNLDEQRIRPLEEVSLTWTIHGLLAKLEEARGPDALDLASQIQERWDQIRMLFRAGFSPAEVRKAG